MIKNIYLRYSIMKLAWYPESGPAKRVENLKKELFTD